ncbi:adenylyltransferase/cytidyltransferase family protein [Neobacillus vireti]|uniref:Glycerol-3-phosphate cytidyltransferase n=1 Tax=Neobacillus vireti LMG 21834 TaxID=1131730 RepID=A0AB94IKM5_9BACI|nr:adenylyltransferase/cytidyltransferase family protein [Neobacillus vireti]ETI67557.1 glycerol-3-phosphate cytidyltransferase [Neobacillus vireti LMG 21834]KLT18492.1 glycerol-3-phosphate cytidylyltransferase [Neobacillus vireti]
MVQKPYKIGYTTGVFDLFHVGHLNILKSAKAQCDYLIVGISTDELVWVYKKKQPVIPYRERTQIIESVKYVDRVVPQINRDKYSAWEQIKFDIMFVGDDWKGDPLFNEVEKKFNQQGVEIVYFPYTHGVSSTIVKKKIEQKEIVSL